ncbi:MAG TPA: Hsp20/alpha crystallin family protein [bacterium]|nr:Hsp20/alpha crystallin family protein [bacterium]
MAEPKELKVRAMLGPLEEEVEFFFSNFFGSSYPSMYRQELCWKPPTDVFETNTDYVVILELAQMKAEEVSITFQEGVLIIRGVRKAVPPSEHRRYHKMEINYGPFERKIAVMEEVDMESLTANYKDGFLEVRLPKVTARESMPIQIEVE